MKQNVLKLCFRLIFIFSIAVGIIFANTTPLKKKGANFPAPFGARPGIVGNGARCTFSIQAGKISLGGKNVFESTQADNPLIFQGNWDKKVKQSTDLYNSGIGKVILENGKTVILPLLNPPTEDFDTAVKLLSSEDFLMRARGAWILGELEDPRGLKILKNSIQESHFYTKKYIEQSIKHLEKVLKNKR